MSRSTEPRPPIIDVHLHALWWGPGMQETLTGICSPETRDCLREATLTAMSRYNIVKGIMSAPLIDEYQRAAPDHMIAGFPLGTAFGVGHPLDIGVDRVRKSFCPSQFEVLAEMVAQYDGIVPGDIRMEPYFAPAEELDIPEGISAEQEVKDDCRQKKRMV